MLFERRTPRFTADEPFRAEASAGYMGNSETQQYGADVAAGNRDWFVRGIVDYTDANNYEDGDGNTVRSAYTNKEGVVILGYTPSDDTRLELSFEANREEDVLFAGAGMDCALQRQRHHAAQVRKRRHPWESLPASRPRCTTRNIDHLMNNFSLRPLSRDPDENGNPQQLGYRRRPDER